MADILTLQMVSRHLVDCLDEKKDKFFLEMVDNLVEFGRQHDQELMNGIQWLDNIAQKEGVSFYDKVYEVLYKKDIQDKAKDWNKGRKL